MLSLLDQIVVSGNTFVYSIVAVRTMTQVEYGVFAVLFTIYLFLNNIQTGVITAPLMVLSQSRTQGDLRDYLGLTLLSQVSLSITLALVGLVSIGVFSIVSQGSESLVRGLLFLSLGIIPLQLYEFFRKVFFAQTEVLKAWRLDLIFAGTSLSLIAVVVTILWAGLAEGRSVGPGLFILLLGLSGFITAIVGFYWLKDSFNLHNRSKFQDIMKENWNYGKWVLGGQVGGVGLIQAQTWMIAGLGGLKAAGAIEASRLLLAPLHVLIFGGSNFLLPFAAQRYEKQGMSSVKALLMRAYPAWIIMFVGYLLVILLFPEFWLMVVLGKSYSGFSIILILWCIIYFIIGLRQLPFVGLSAMRRPDIGMIASLAAGFFSLIAVTVLLTFVSATWALVGRLLGEILLLTISIVYLQRLFHIQSGEQFFGSKIKLIADYLRGHLF